MTPVPFGGWLFPMNKSTSSRRAIAELEKAVSLREEGTLSRGLLANAYALAGETGRASSVLNQLKELSRKRYVSPVDIAIVGFSNYQSQSLTTTFRSTVLGSAATCEPCEIGCDIQRSY
jgi:hypothetical protein